MYQDWTDDKPGKPEDDEAQDIEVMVYNPSGLNFAIEDHFAALQLQLPIAIGGRVMCAHMQLCPAHLDDSSPHGLLYLAVYVNHPELHVPVVKRKRLEKGKHVHHSFGRAIAMLQSNPSTDLGWPVDRHTSANKVIENMPGSWDCDSAPSTGLPSSSPAKFSIRRQTPC